MPHSISSTHVGNHKQEIPARPISQCNQSSPTSVIIRNIGHSQTIIKPKILSFWLLFAIAPNNRIKKQIKRRHCRYEQLKPSQLRKLFDHRKNISCFAPPLRTSIRKMILLVKQPINHEYAHLYFAINQKNTAKTTDTCKIQYNQCHHQHHTSAAHLSRWCTYVPFSPNRYCMYISSTSPLLVLSTPEKHYKFFGFTKTV